MNGTDATLGRFTSFRYVEMLTRPGEHSHGPDARLVQCDPDERCLLGHSEKQWDSMGLNRFAAEFVIPYGIMDLEGPIMIGIMLSAINGGVLWSASIEV